MNGDRVTQLGGHVLFVGRAFFRIGGRPVTAAQLVFRHHYPHEYEPGVPVFSHCGIRGCVHPEHLHVSVLSARYREEAA